VGDVVVEGAIEPGAVATAATATLTTKVPLHRLTKIPTRFIRN
jgi:hypothetical protein